MPGTGNVCQMRRANRAYSIAVRVESRDLGQENAPFPLRLGKRWLKARREDGRISGHPRPAALTRFGRATGRGLRGARAGCCARDAGRVAPPPRGSLSAARGPLRSCERLRSSFSQDSGPPPTSIRLLLPAAAWPHPRPRLQAVSRRLRRGPRAEGLRALAFIAASVPLPSS